MTFCNRVISMSSNNKPSLFIPLPKWRRLLQDLWLRSEGVHESGAFLLGEISESKRTIVDWILYDDFDPASLDTGIVRLNGDKLGALWERCRKLDLTVVADIHTHPGVARQSRSDSNHPVIALPGHLALIVPRFARPPVPHAEIGVFQYQGRKQWRRYAPIDVIDLEGKVHG